MMRPIALACAAAFLAAAAARAEPRTITVAEYLDSWRLLDQVQALRDDELSRSLKARQPAIDAAIALIDSVNAFRRGIVAANQAAKDRYGRPFLCGPEPKADGDSTRADVESYVNRLRGKTAQPPAIGQMDVLSVLTQETFDRHRCG